MWFIFHSNCIGELEISSLLKNVKIFKLYPKNILSHWCLCFLILLVAYSFGFEKDFTFLIRCIGFTCFITGYCARGKTAGRLADKLARELRNPSSWSRFSCGKKAFLKTESLYPRLRQREPNKYLNNLMLAFSYTYSAFTSTKARVDKTSRIVWKIIS